MLEPLLVGKTEYKKQFCFYFFLDLSKFFLKTDQVFL